MASISRQIQPPPEADAGTPGVKAQDERDCLESINVDGWWLTGDWDPGFWIANDDYPVEVQIVPDDTGFDEHLGLPVVHAIRRSPWHVGGLPPVDQAKASARRASESILLQLPPTLLDELGFVIGRPGVGGAGRPGRPPTIDHCMLVAIRHVLTHRPDHDFGFTRSTASKLARRCVREELATEAGELTPAGRRMLEEMLGGEPCGNPSARARKHCSVCIVRDAGLRP